MCLNYNRNLTLPSFCCFHPQSTPRNHYKRFGKIILRGSSFISLYLTIIGFSIKIAYDTREPFGRLLVIGLISILSMQTFVNIGITIGLAPVTGLTLPFVSYGGSSLVTSYLAIGIVLSVGTWSVPSFSSMDHDYRDDIIRETPLRGGSLLSG